MKKLILSILFAAGIASAQTNFQDLLQNGILKARISDLPPSASSGDMATATRIESSAKTISVNSTLRTVAQNGERPIHPLALGGVRRPAASSPPVKCRYTRNSR